MRSIKLMVLLLALTLVACNSTKKSNPEDGRQLTIKGKIGFPESGKIILSEIRQDDQKPKEDSTSSNGNLYELKVNVKEPGYYRLSFYGKQFVNLILDTTDLEINVDGNDPQGFSEVKGSPDMDLIMGVQKIMQDAQASPEMKALEAEFQTAAQSKDQKKVTEIQEKYMAAIAASYDKIAALLGSAPPSLGLINVLQNNNPLDKDKYFQLYLDTAEKLKKGWADNYYAKAFIESVEAMKKTAIGQPAPEISLPTPDGDTLKLSSFKGKYVLVDFWAKWCGPCRQENPNVVKAYKQFKGKNFDILSVSLDRTKEDWVKAIQEDGLVWHHVSDLKYFDSQAAHDYNISGIPFSILVDPSGIIIAKNLRGSNLQKKLDEVLNKKS